MSITNNQIDIFINTTINRFSSNDGPSTSCFYVDLREYQNRITEKLVNDCISKCNARGLDAERIDDGLSVTVNLNKCTFTTSQSNMYNEAMNIRRFNSDSFSL